MINLSANRVDIHSNLKILLIYFIVLMMNVPCISQGVSYPVVDTEVIDFSDNSAQISPPASGDPFYGQDATYTGNRPSYTNNGNGTITDNVTGLTWEQHMGDKITWADAFIKSDTMTLGGFDDWRVPTIKELYSLILFTGRVQGATAIDKFIDTDYFDQPLGDTDLGEREIDAQTWSSTRYRGLTMNGDSTVFGVNFVDGRIKGYPQYKPGTSNTVPRTMYFRMVRGNPSYGINDYTDNNNGTITDRATGLMWQKADDGIMRDWESALRYAEGLELGGYDNWRLPNAKELQSIVDYTRSPQSTGSPAIDPLFSTTGILDPDGNPGQYPYFWSGTTHLDGPVPYSGAVYVAFGEARGIMNDKLMDVHGAGAQRSDPKTGDVDAYPQYHGPQGDVQYVFNAVRCVRDIDPPGGAIIEGKVKNNSFIYPNPTSDKLNLTIDDSRVHQVNIYNMFGPVMNNMHIGTSETIDLSCLKPGIYFINFDGLATGKFIKR